MCLRQDSQHRVGWGHLIVCLLPLPQFVTIRIALWYLMGGNWLWVCGEQAVACQLAVVKGIYTAVSLQKPSYCKTHFVSNTSFSPQGVLWPVSSSTPKMLFPQFICQVKKCPKWLYDIDEIMHYDQFMYYEQPGVRKTPKSKNVFMWYS